MKKHNWSYRAKLRFSMIIFSLIPGILCFIMIFAILSIPKIRQIERDKAHFFQRSVTQMNITFDSMTNYCNSLAFDLNVGKIFDIKDADDVVYQNVKNADLLSTFLLSFKDELTENIVLYHNNESMFETRYSKPISSIVHDLDMKRLNRGEFIWESDDNLIYLYKKFEAIAEDVTVIISYTINKSSINKIINDFSLSEDVIYASQQTDVDVENIKFVKKEKLLNGDVLILKPATDYYKSIYTEAAAYALLFFIVMILLIWYSSLNATKRLTKEVYALIDIARQEVSLGVYEFSDDSELKPVYTKLQSLIAKVLELNKEKMTIERRRVAAELQYVQSKINPHLLYNALSTIKWACMDVDKNIANSIDSLVDYYRFTVLQGHIIDFKTEIDLIKKYVLLMSRIHSCEYNLSVDIPQEILETKTIMHIFQPFVENSILHGIKNYPEGKICIKVFYELDNLIIKISDNGIGILPERLEQLKKMDYDSKYHSFGIKNTLERIKLFYNKDCNIEISSEYKKGTDILITIPNCKSINLEDFYS